MDEHKSYMDAMAKEVRRVAVLLESYGTCPPELFPVALEIVKHTSWQWKPPISDYLSPTMLVCQTLDRIAAVLHGEAEMSDSEKMTSLKGVLQDHYNQMLGK